MPIAKAIPSLSGSTDHSADLSRLRLFHGLHTAVRIQARRLQPVLVSGWQSFDNRARRGNTNTMWEESRWLSCTEMNHQFKFDLSFSGWQGRGVLIRQHIQLVQNVSLFTVSQLFSVVRCILLPVTGLMIQSESFVGCDERGSPRL